MCALKSTVAEHYNNLEQRGIEERRQSRIIHLRNFNNWTKSVSINEAIETLRRRNPRREIRVLDLGCGKGGDLRKWAIGRVQHVVCADMAETSIQQAADRYKEMQSFPGRQKNQLFSAEFIAADCADARLTEKYMNPDQMFDLVSSQFSFHYSFESYQMAERMLCNACERLSPGGIFMGTIPDAHEIVKRLEQSDLNGFGNEIYSVTFDSKERGQIFGAKYHFFLQDSVNCPEFLVNFPVLQKMAAKFKMKCVFRQTFQEFFDQYSNRPFYKKLLEKMDALETFPAESPMGCVEEGEYELAQTLLRQRPSLSRVGCLSKSEWEVASMYIAFAFQKEDESIPEKIKNPAGSESDARSLRLGNDKKDLSGNGDNMPDALEQRPPKRPRQ